MSQLIWILLAEMPLHVSPCTYSKQKNNLLCVLHLEKVRLLISLSVVRRGKLLLFLMISFSVVKEGKLFASPSNGCRQQADYMLIQISCYQLCSSVQLHSLCVTPLWTGLCTWSCSIKDYNEICKWWCPDTPGHIINSPSSIQH